MITGKELLEAWRRPKIPDLPNPCGLVGVEVNPAIGNLPDIELMAYFENLFENYTAFSKVIYFRGAFIFYK